MNIELELILLQIRIHMNSPLEQSLPQIPQPGNMLLLQIAQTPDIPPLHKSKKVQRPHRLPVPVQIWQHQEPIFRPMTGISQDDILLLRAPLQNIKHPVQPALLPLGAHVRPDVVAVDLGGLGDHAEHLIGVLLDVLFRARPDEVQLEIGGGLARGVRAGRRHVPPVDVIVAQVVDARDGCVECTEDLEGFCSEGGAFGN